VVHARGTTIVAVTPLPVASAISTAAGSPLAHATNTDARVKTANRRIAARPM
jgi:hypothetical protein